MLLAGNCWLPSTISGYDFMLRRYEIGFDLIFALQHLQF